MTFSSSSSKMCWDNGIWRKLLFPLRVMSWWILHYTEWEHTSHLQLKDGHDHHPNWLAWYYWCIVLTKLGVSFNERDLTDRLYLLTWYLVQRGSKVQCVNRILNGSSTAIPVFTFCGNLPVYLHRFINIYAIGRAYTCGMWGVKTCEKHNFYMICM